MKPRPDHQRSDLATIARRAMLAHGLLPDFDAAARRQVEAMPDAPATARAGGEAVRDLTTLPWCSIDNDDSRDLDQLSAGEPLGDGAARLRVAIADVDSRVGKGTPLDAHAAHNTTSVYTGACIFPMLPERLSTDLTSLNPHEPRLAVVVELVERDGRVAEATLYRARVRNQAQLAYDGVGAWLAGEGPLPPAAAAVPGLAEALRLQDAAAQRLRAERYAQGALELQTLEARPVFDGERITELREERPNRARQLIEDLMVAANGATARHLASRGVVSLRRVVRSPERWRRIVEVAAGYGETLSAEPDSLALQRFLQKRRRADPLRFPDLSLVIIKLMGPGEYVVEAPGGEEPGHFGLAVRAYTHSTAPNRRFADLVTQRLVKATLAGAPSPYPATEVATLALHCTQQEDAANKVERQVRKSAAALLLEHEIGERYDAVVTGASDKGTWVRLLHPPVEGKLVRGEEGLRVGDTLRVELVATDVERGFLDFVRR